MSQKAGSLLWSRQRITVPAATTLAAGTIDVDTGLVQLNMGLSMAGASQGEPPMGSSGTVAPADGTLPASRVQVCPLVPIASWTGITHSEPYVNTTTKTIHVKFSNSGGSVVINILFWDPHTIMGPGQANTYHA